jgi:hypothetical protein
VRHELYGEQPCAVRLAQHQPQEGVHQGKERGGGESGEENGWIESKRVYFKFNKRRLSNQPQ